MSESIESRTPFRVRGRSLMALVLTPTPGLVAWLATLDEQIARSPGFFDDRAVILDLSLLPPDEPDLPGLLSALSARSVNVVGTEGAHPSWTGLGVPSLPATTRPLRMFSVPETPEPPVPAVPATPAPAASLLLDRPVRSGQTVTFDRGDVTVVGAVASGAEIIASGSIHIYGALRGRAVAGVAGSAEARIFCARMEAELVAIGGVYLTADQVPKSFRGRAVQVRLDQQALTLAPLD